MDGVKLVVGDKCLGMLEAVGEVFPEAKYQRCTVHFYRNVFSVTPRSKVKLVAKMLKAIHAQESKKAAREKAKAVVEELRSMKLKEAAKKVEDSIEETLTYCDFPSEHWTRIRTNNVIERLNREIRRRTRVVGSFPDGNSALMLVCARLHHVAGTQWGTRSKRTKIFVPPPKKSKPVDLNLTSLLLLHSLRLFLHLNTDCMQSAMAATGRKGYDKAAMLCAYIVMKCEGFSQLTDLVDYLQNNLLIAYYCGFDITGPLPSYWTFGRFLRELDNGLLKQVMQTQVKQLVELGILDASFIGLDSTPVAASTKQNNPKSFVKNKFSKSNQPKNDMDCRLGVHTASNQQNEKNYEFYWGYKNHVLVDCITGLPIFELTTTADVHGSTVAVEILSQTNSFLPLEDCTFLADKGYDAKSIYNTVKETYHGEAIIPLNVRSTKDPKKLPVGNPICDAGLAMHRDGQFHDNGRTRQKFCCPFKRTSHLHDCPCHHKNFHKGSSATGCCKYSTIPDDYRLSYSRDTAHFKKLYALRTECERYNSRFKATGQERLWVFSFAAAANLNSIAHIALLAIALAAVSCKMNSLYRSLKRLKRSA